MKNAQKSDESEPKAERVCVAIVLGTYMVIMKGVSL